MILLPVILLTLFPPGFFFPSMTKHGRAALASDADNKLVVDDVVSTGPGPVPNMTYAKQNNTMAEMTVVDSRV